MHQPDPLDQPCRPLLADPQDQSHHQHPLHQSHQRGLARQRRGLVILSMYRLDLPGLSLRRSLSALLDP